MNEQLIILMEIRELLTQQIAAAQKELSPDEIVEYDKRSRRIRELAERLKEKYSSEG